MPKAYAAKQVPAELIAAVGGADAAPPGARDVVANDDGSFRVVLKDGVFLDVLRETEAECAEKICITEPSGSFHIHDVASSEPASSTAPRACQHSQFMPCDGPSSAVTSSPVSARR